MRPLSPPRRRGRGLSGAAALAALCVLLLPGPAAAAPRPIVPPLATDGARIVDAAGRTAILQGVNWFGFETANHVVHGLWSRDYRDVLAQVRRLGFNTIRLPFSLQALESRDITGVDFSGGRNAALEGATPLEAMDVIVDAAAREGLLVLLDAHAVQDGGHHHGLWYGPGGATEEDWVRAWRRLARRYANRPNVIGADLKNEPHGEASWGTGGLTDWRRAAERAGNAVLAIAPHWLIVVEGVEGRVPGQRLERHWWGGNLEGVRRAPVRLSRPGRLVYSPHEYGPGVFPQPWFARPGQARELERRWRTGFGFILDEGIAPVLVGEFGGREVGLDTAEGRWQRQFLDHLGRRGISWTYWALNPNSGDTGGILRDDWRTVDREKMALLARALERRPIRFRGAPAPPPPPAREAPAPAPREAPAPPALAPPAPAPPAPAPPAPAPPHGGEPARVVVQSTWPGGWCVRLEISEPAGATGVRLRLPPGARVAQTWNLELSGRSGTVTGLLPAWAEIARGAPFTAAGLCGEGGAPTEVSAA